MLAVGFNSNDIRLWNITEQKCAHTISGIHDGPVNCIKYLNNGNQIISSSKDSTLKVTDLRTLKAVRTIEH
jgi:WD40 repeat protein